MGVAGSLRNWASRLKRDALTLWFAWRHPRTPLWVKGLCLFIVAYALSPIDLIPDFIPVLGYLDDAILLPVLIWLALRMLPPDILHECRVQTQDWIDRHVEKPRMWAGAVLILVFWLIAIWLGWRWWRVN
jgi:uncharacterized membrane protein YkvA (DUF1232 family)